MATLQRDVPDDYEQQTSVMQLRLETDRQLEKIKGFLTGKKVTYKQVANGDVVTTVEEWVTVSKPKLNEEGIHAISEWMQTHIDPALVQGNLEKWDDLKEFMYYFRQDFADTVTLNFFKWEIQAENYDQIIDPICNMIRLFLSRTVGNLERESYVHTLRTMESSKLQTEDKTQHGWSLFRRSGQNG